MLYVVTGGSGSGKSALAEAKVRQLKMRFTGNCYYVATMLATDDEETKKLISFLKDAETAACTRGERGFLAAVECGCQVPVGVYGQVQADNLKLEAIIASLDGTQLLRESITGPVAEAEALGQRLAQNMLDKGGRAILAEIGINL